MRINFGQKVSLNIKNLFMKNNKPYYLLPLDEQADQVILSESGQSFISACKKYIAKLIK